MLKGEGTMAQVITSTMVGKPTKDEDFPWTPTNIAEQANKTLLLKHLKPCPFCGMMPTVRVCGTHSGYEVYCNKCGIPEVREYWDDFCEEYHKRTKQRHTDIPWNIPLAGTMNKIIKRWNQRAMK